MRREAPEPSPEEKRASPPPCPAPRPAGRPLAAASLSPSRAVQFLRNPPNLFAFPVFRISLSSRLSHTLSAQPISSTQLSILHPNPNPNNDWNEKGRRGSRDSEYSQLLNFSVNGSKRNQAETGVNVGTREDFFFFKMGGIAECLLMGMIQ